MARNMLHTIHSVTSKYTNVRASVQLPSECKWTWGELKNTVLVGCSLELSILCVTRLFTLWPAAKRDFSSTNKIVTNDNIVQYVCFTMANFGKVITWQSNTDVLDVLFWMLVFIARTTVPSRSRFSLQNFTLIQSLTQSQCLTQICQPGNSDLIFKPHVIIHNVTGYRML